MIQPAVLCVGRVYCDLVFSGLKQPPQPGLEVYAEGLSLHTGGGAAITAHNLARLGRKVELCASIPASPFNKIVQSDLEPAVSLKYCTEQTELSPQITVVLTGYSDRSFITNRAIHALPENYHDCIKQCAIAGQVKHLHIAELATLIEHPDLIALARSANWTVSLDCAWDNNAMQSKETLELIEKVDVFLPNDTEFLEVERLGLPRQLSTIVVTKKGEEGAQATSKDGLIEVAVNEDVPCVDTTGAGDAFNAGFIDAWLRHEPLSRCLAAGNKCGATTIGHFGGIRSE